MPRNMTSRYVSLSILLLFFLSSCRTTQPDADDAMPAAPETSMPSPDAAAIPLDPAVQHGRLENGLAYYIRQNEEPQNRAELRLVINAGSMQEEDDQLGMAHFLEHMLFNGTERFPEQDLVEFLERTGLQFGPDLNAYTSFDETVYILSIPTDSMPIVEQAFDVLEDWASAATIACRSNIEHFNGRRYHPLYIGWINAHPLCPYLHRTFSRYELDHHQR